MSSLRSTTVPPPLVEERSIGGIDAQRCPETNSGEAAASGIRGIFKAPLWGVFNAR